MTHRTQHILTGRILLSVVISLIIVAVIHGLLDAKNIDLSNGVLLALLASLSTVLSAIFFYFTRNVKSASLLPTKVEITYYANKKKASDVIDLGDISYITYDVIGKSGIDVYYIIHLKSGKEIMLQPRVIPLDDLIQYAYAHAILIKKKELVPVE